MKYSGATRFVAKLVTNLVVKLVVNLVVKLVTNRAVKFVTNLVGKLIIKSSGGYFLSFSQFELMLVKKVNERKKVSSGLRLLFFKMG